MRLTWPLTGRSQEMRLIESALSDADCAGIVISGAAGVGKSRMTREALDAAALRGWETRWVVATSSARGLPLGALASLAGSTNPDTLQLVRDVIEALTCSASGCPVAVGVDDAHLLDDLSVFVLHQIVQRRAAKLVLTIRDREPIPVGLQEVGRPGEFDRLDLQPLSSREIAMLVSGALGGSLEPDASRRLWDLTRGNVLYLCNIVEQEVAEARLTQQQGRWRWRADPVIPASLVQLIDSRIGALPPAVSDVVDALAVGEPLPLRLLQRIADAAAVEEADLRGLTTLESRESVGEGVEVRLAHPLYGEVRRERAAQTRLRRLRGRVATELAAADDRDDVRVVVRRATLSLDSDLEPDETLLIAAAKGAVWLADLQLADRLADAAIRGGAGAEAHFVRAHVLSWLGRGPEADKVLASTPTHDFTGADHARLAFMRATVMLWTLANPSGAKELIDDAAQTLQSEDRGPINAFLTVYWAVMGKPEMARKTCAEIAWDRLPDAAGTNAAWAIALSSGHAGRTTEALNAADAGSAIASRVADSAFTRFSLIDVRVGALLQSGRVVEAIDVAERMRQEAADMPGSSPLRAAAVAGRAALGAGRLDAACALMEPITEVLAAAGDTNGWGYRYQIPLTMALAIRGASDQAAAAIATLDNQRHPSWRWLDYEHSLARAWVAGCQGAVSEAIKVLLVEAETACANGQFAGEVMCLQTATQFGDRSCAARLQKLESVVEGPRVGVAARFAAALHAGDAAELASVSEEYEQMGDVVAALDASAYAALAYRRQDLRGSALGCSTRAEALAEHCGAMTPALRQASERLPLTDREREIVMLLAEGLGSREIAERLTVSRRTVEGHIYHAMTKTGVASREELAALLSTHRARAQT
jgi:DNA-binding CsgD family transcriptional regulator